MVLGSRLLSRGLCRSPLPLLVLLVLNDAVQHLAIPTCLPPAVLSSLAMVAASRPVGSSTWVMPEYYLLHATKTPRRLRGTFFYPVAIQCWCWNICEATTSESVRGSLSVLGPLHSLWSSWPSVPMPVHLPRDFSLEWETEKLWSSNSVSLPSLHLLKSQVLKLHDQGSNQSSAMV